MEPSTRASLASVGLYVGAFISLSVVLAAVGHLLELSAAARGLGSANANNDNWRVAPAALLGGALGAAVLFSMADEAIEEEIRCVTGLRPTDAARVLRDAWWAK